MPVIALAHHGAGERRRPGRPLDRLTTVEEGGAIGLIEEGDRIEIDIPARSINVMVDDTTLAKRRAAMEAKGKEAWKPAKPRPRKVSKALRAYAAFATSASRGAVREVP